MKLKMTVTPEVGESFEVTIKPITQVAFEREFKITISDSGGADHMYWMAWHSLGVLQPPPNLKKRYDQATSPERDAAYMEWLAGIESVDPVDEEEADAAPLVETPPPGDSLPSPSSPVPDSPSPS